MKIKKEKNPKPKNPTFASPGLEQAADRAEAAAERQYTYGDNDVISFSIYARWFSPPSCG